MEACLETWESAPALLTPEALSDLTDGALSEQSVRYACRNSNMPGAVKVGRRWLIVKDEFLREVKCLDKRKARLAW